jgi:hypothetical protein
LELALFLNSRPTSFLGKYIIALMTIGGLSAIAVTALSFSKAFLVLLNHQLGMAGAHSTCADWILHVDENG